jgi:hypothetical protein
MADSEPPSKEPDAVVADTAALAANSAERAQAAAADTMAQAQVAAATVAHQAAEEIRSTTEGLSEWQTSIQAQSAALAESLRVQQEKTEARLKETMDAILSIQTRLDKPPEIPPSPDQGSKEKSPPEGEAKPREEPKPERKRAHRWI